MTTPAFCKTIGAEMQTIGNRCAEIEATMGALEQERLVLVERQQALDTIQTLYQSSQQQIDDAMVIQASTSGRHFQAAVAEE